MKKINNILVPTDFSENALNAFRYAVWFADYYRADIHLLHVVYPAAAPMDHPTLSTQMMQQQIETAKEVMKSFAESAMVPAPAGSEPDFLPTITTDVLVGTPQDQVQSLVEEKGYDLVIMGTQGEHNTLEKTFGSVTSAVMQKANCPLIVVPEKTTVRKIETIAYATNFTEADPFFIWQIGKLLNPFNAIMRVVHVEKSPNEKRPLKMNDLKAFFRENPPALQVNYHSIAAKSIETELKEFEETWEVDLMVMARPNRGFFERLFHRSMTKHMTFNTTVPLMILKAEK